MVRSKKSEWEKFTSRLLNRHAKALGHVSLAWTGLYEQLASLFSMILRPDQPMLAWAAWHAVGSDRYQRAMLKALAGATLHKEDKRYVELKWALDRLDGLENNRNDALHSPYTLVLEDGRVQIIPNYFGGNKRALNLLNRDLGIELESYATNLREITRYISAIATTLPHPLGVAVEASWQMARTVPLPPRPRLPKPAHDHARKRRVARAKQPRPSQSSEG
jgi:hypothetical protein